MSFILAQELLNLITPPLQSTLMLRFAAKTHAPFLRCRAYVEDTDSYG
jgi:hypothetical protein